MKTRLFLLLLFGAFRTMAQTTYGSWTPLGPIETFSMVNNDPQQKAFPHQTNTYKIESSLSHPSVVYAVGQWNHIYKSLDKGKNWTCVTNNYFLGDAKNALVIHPTNPDIVYAAGENGVVHRTLNGGTTWSPVSTIGSPVFDIKIAPDEPSVLLAGTEAGIYRSSNSGVSWGTAPIISRHCYDLEFKPGDPMVIYAVVYNSTTKTTEFHKSTTKGLGFQRKYIVPNVADNQAGARIGVTAIDPQRVYFVDLSAGLSLFRSDDAGITFTPGATTASERAAGRGDFCECQGYYDMAINVSPTNPDHLITGTLTALKSTDGGLTFPTAVSNAPFAGHSDLQDIWVNGTETYMTSDGGVMFSTDFFTLPANAEARNKGIIGQEILHMDQGWDEDVVITGVMHNGNILQSERYNGKSIFIDGHEQGTGWLLHGQRKYVTCDAGNMIYPYNFTDPAQPFIYARQPNHEGVADRTSEILIDPRYYNHQYVGFENKIYETWDGGTSFKVIFTASSWVLKMEIGRDNPNVIYAAVLDDANLYKTENGGVDWLPYPLPSGWKGYRTDLAINPENSKNIWIVNYDKQNLDKVYESTKGGLEWKPMNATNSPLLDGYRLLDVRLVGGTKKGVYITADKEISSGAVKGDKMKVFYKDSTSGWIDFSNGLPLYDLAVKKSRIFYRDAKLRSATTSGVWETPLYDQNIRPLAQPSVDKKEVQCGVADTFNFYDYSILKYAGANRLWSFSPAPLYVSSTTSLRPKVVFGAAGSYSVTLTVTDASGKTSTKTIPNMVTVAPVAAIVTDSVPGNSLLLADKSLGAFPALKKPSPSVTIMAWIKRNGPQDFLAGVVMTRSNNQNYGIQVKENGSIGYEWHSTHWYEQNDSLLADNKWTHVALVVTPTSGTVYFNGTAVKTISAAHPAIQFENALYLGAQNENDRFFNGEIDEVAIYQKAMTAQEIREQMHLTKKPGREPTLIAYFQMNETNGKIYNKAQSCNGQQIGGVTGTTVPSTAPVGGGVSYMVNVTNGGAKIFSGTVAYPVGNTGLVLHFPATGTYPTGNVVVTRLNVKPDVLPAGVRANPQYWIINNYGTKAQFSTLSSLAFSRAGLVSSAEQANLSGIKLYSRAFNAEGASWGAPKDNADVATAGADANVAFSTGNGVNSFSKQLVIGFAPVTANQAPTVTLTSPANNNTYPAPASIQLSATASDPDGTISKVAFYNGSTLIQTVTSAPYTYTWNNVAANQYTITAVATDNLNLSATSSAATVSVSTVTSTADILGPDCGTAGAALSFKINPAVWPNATNINWYYQNAGTISPANTATTTLTGASPFGPGNICVGFSDANGNYQSNKCKYIPTCLSPRMEDAFGMESIGNSAKAKVYPNPVRNILYVQTESQEAGELKVTLIDGLSKQVLEKTISLSKGEATEELDVTGFKTGNYTLILNRGASVMIKRIVIQNNSKSYRR